MRLEDKLRGWSRIWPAFKNTLAGFKAGWAEPAFHMEAWIAAFMGPFAFVLGKTWLETGFLLATLVLVLIVELLNTAVEVLVNRIGFAHHELSGRAKDIGSAAVLLAMLLVALVWGLLLL